MSAVAVLFARQDSIYKTIPGCDVYDIDRDARTYAGSAPVIAHPPCRAWGTLRHLAKPRHDEKDLALFAIAQVRKFGGCLEHPKRSTLWPVALLPAPGQVDEFGGWTLPIFQSDFGHLAQKATLLYIVGCMPAQIPTMPMVLGDATHVIASSDRKPDGSRRRKGDRGWRPKLEQKQREHTPPALAAWLYHLALRCRAGATA